MEDYPKTVLEFEEWFYSEESCREYLFRLRWPEGFKCPQCGHCKAWSTNRDLYHCESCGFQTSVTSGTIFQGSKKSLCLWFRAMWHITSQKYGANALGLKRVLGLGSYHTAWEWLHKLRRAMVRPDRDQISGVVEVDETYIGGKKEGKRGRGAAGKALVILAVEDKGKGIGRIRLGRVLNASSDSLTHFIQCNIEPGSIIKTDGWSSYNELESKGYKHIVVRKDAVIGDNLLPITHLVASLLKRWLLGTYQGAARISYLDYYLDEFTFRFNRRTSYSRGKLFYRLVVSFRQACVKSTKEMSIIDYSRGKNMIL